MATKKLDPTEFPVLMPTHVDWHTIYRITCPNCGYDFNLSGRKPNVDEWIARQAIACPTCYATWQLTVKTFETLLERESHDG